MVLFLVRHEHEPRRCPAADPRRGAMLLSHLSRPNARRHGLDTVGDVVIQGEHAIQLIVGSGDERRVREIMTPLAEARFGYVGTDRLLPAL